MPKFYTLRREIDGTHRVFADTNECGIEGCCEETDTALRIIRKNKMDKFANWLYEKMPNLIVTVQGWVIEGQMPPPPYFEIWFDDTLLSMDASISYGRQFMKEEFDAQTNLGATGSATNRDAAKT